MVGVELLPLQVLMGLMGLMGLLLLHGEGAPRAGVAWRLHQRRARLWASPQRPGLGCAPF